MTLFLLILFFIIWSLLCLAMAIMPRRAIRLERLVFLRLRIVSRERCECPIGRLNVFLTILLGGLCGLTGILCIGTVLLCRLYADTAEFTPAASGRFTRSLAQIASPPPPPLNDDLRTSITSTIQPMISSCDHVGIVVGVIHGRESEVLGFGRSEVSKDTPPDANTRFEIGSITKVFTASALACMVQNGEVRLDQPVQDLLPAGTRVPEYKGRKITCLDLVSQTSGLPRIPDNLNSFSDYVTFRFISDPYSTYSPAKLLDFLANHHLAKAPGAEYEYSNLGMGLLGFALSHKRGQSYEQMVRELICAPLDLNDTVVNVPQARPARLARGYSFSFAEGGKLIGFGLGPWKLQDSTAGAGALCSTGQDMVKFMAANLGMMETSVTTQFERTHAVRHRISDELDMGMAWHEIREVAGLNGPFIWHNGETGGFSSIMAFHKPSRSGVVILSNTASSVDMAGFKILKMVAMSK